MDSVIERSLTRVPPMYRPFLKQCHTEMRGDVLVVHAPDSAVFSRVATERIRDALREESGGEVRFELSVEAPLPQSDIPLPRERLPRMVKRGKSKAIETVYDGYRFRSRLEARWAVFFHEAGIEYQYEPEGFRGWNGPYLPDFYFPEYEVYAEVKGTDEALEKDAAKIAGAIRNLATPISSGLLILGEIPNYEKISPGNVPVFSLLSDYHGAEHDGIAVQCAAFVPKDDGIGLAMGGHDILTSLFLFPHNVLFEGEIAEYVSVKCKWIATSLLTHSDLCYGRLKQCYQKARQARFEHGENGK